MKILIDKETLVGLDNFRNYKRNTKLLSGSRIHQLAVGSEYGDTPDHELMAAIKMYNKDIHPKYGRTGILIEPVSKSLVEKQFSIKIETFDAKEINFDNFPHLEDIGGLVDGFILDEHSQRVGVWENKTTGIKNHTKWLNSIPESYRVQVLFYLYCANLKSAKITCCFLGDDVYGYTNENEVIRSINKYNKYTINDISPQSIEGGTLDYNHLRDAIISYTCEITLTPEDTNYIEAIIQKAKYNIKEVAKRGFFVLDETNKKDEKVLKLLNEKEIKLENAPEETDQIIELIEQIKLLESQKTSLLEDLMETHRDPDKSEETLVFPGTSKKIKCKSSINYTYDKSFEENLDYISNKNMKSENDKNMKAIKENYRKEDGVKFGKPSISKL